MLTTIANADRVQETTATTGTGTLTLAGASSQYQGFFAAVGANTVPYYILAGNGTDWETGYGVVGGSGPYTLSRQIIVASTNSGSAVSLTGTSTVGIGLFGNRGNGGTLRLQPIGSINSTIGFYPAPIALPTLVNGSTFTLRVLSYRPTSNAVTVGVFNGSNNGYFFQWQTDNNAVLYKDAAGTTTSIKASGGTVPPITNGTYQLFLRVSVDTTNGHTFSDGIDYVYSGVAQDNTYNFTTGTWTAYCGATTIGNVRDFSVSFDSNP